MPAPSREIVVEWFDAELAMALAVKRGWTEGGDCSLLDLVDDDECDQTRTFPSMTKAKAWYARNRQRDLYGEPRIYVYEWPCERRRSWERETVRCLYYCGGGYGWQEIEQ